MRVAFYARSSHNIPDIQEQLALLQQSLQPQDKSWLLMSIQLLLYSPIAQPCQRL
jgi:hypothetical protein